MMGRFMAEHGPERLDGLFTVDVDYLGFDHHALKQMVDVGNDPGQVDDMAGAWREVGGAFARFGHAIAGAVTASETEWQGAAADQARDVAAEMGNWFGGVAVGAEAAGASLATQAEAAGTARRSMPEPVDFSILDALTMLKSETNPVNLPTVMSDIRQQFEAKQQAHAEAANVVRAYDTTLYETAATMPAFAPPPDRTTDSVAESGSSDGGIFGGGALGMVGFAPVPRMAGDDQPHGSARATMPDTAEGSGHGDEPPGDEPPGDEPPGDGLVSDASPGVARPVIGE
jgi:hypothetical protein